MQSSRSLSSPSASRLRAFTMIFYVAALAYAAALVGFGLNAYLSAPAEANAKTALIIPGACAAVVLLLACVGIFASGLLKNGRAHAALPMAAQPPLTPTNRTLSMVSAHALMVLPFIFAALFFVPYRARMAQQANYPQAKQAFDAAVAEGKQFPTRDDRKAFFKTFSSPDHDTKYLTNTLLYLILISLAIGVELIYFGFLARKSAKMIASETGTAASTRA